MSDLSYRCAYCICYPAFWVSSRPVVLHRERARRGGGYILAPNHLSPLDVPLIIRHTPRNLDFVSIVEFLEKPFVRWFFGLWNTLYLNRNRSDPVAMRQAVDRLRRGRVIAMFPEGNIRDEAHSVVNGGAMKPGIARLAEIADVPVVPCVVLDSRKYLRVTGWLPIRRTRYGIIFGNPLVVRIDLDKHNARAIFVQELSKAYQDLAVELRGAMNGPACA